MSIKNKIIFTIFIIICVCFLFCGLFFRSEKCRTTRFFVFNTPCNVTFWGVDETSWDATVAELLSTM